MEMGTPEEPVGGVEGVSSVTHHGSACSPSWRHRTSCGSGEEERQDSGGTSFGVDGTNDLYTAFGLKTSLKPPVGALSNCSAGKIAAAVLKSPVPF